VTNKKKTVMATASGFNCFKQNFKDQQKDQLSARKGGYRNKEGYRRVNQSTSTIQMRSSLSSFQESFFIPMNRKRSSLQQYHKVVNGHRTIENQKEQSMLKTKVSRKNQESMSREEGERSTTVTSFRQQIRTEHESNIF
jgi:hypothetical protein